MKLYGMSRKLYLDQGYLVFGFSAIFLHFNTTTCPLGFATLPNGSYIQSNYQDHVIVKGIQNCSSAEIKSEAKRSS